MSMIIINSNGSSAFTILCEFFDESRETEISMVVNGKNILSFECDGELQTTRWDLDEIALWMRDFLDHMTEDPYPVETDGEFAAMKDISARDFDSDDDDEFDAYYDRLDDWNLRHRWHPASSGAILADLYFQLVGENVEISWNNLEADEGVTFSLKLGGVRVKKEEFVEVVNGFLESYAEHWF